MPVTRTATITATSAVPTTGTTSRGVLPGKGGEEMTDPTAARARARDERTCPRCAHRIHPGCPDCQPAPTPRETTADELAEAEPRYGAYDGDHWGLEDGLREENTQLREQLAKRGRECDAARAEVEYQRRMRDGWEDEAEQLRDERAELLHSLRESHEEQERVVKSLQWLRGRYEAAKPVVQAFHALDGTDAAAGRITVALDALARAHEDGERDR